MKDVILLTVTVLVGVVVFTLAIIGGIELIEGDADVCLVHEESSSVYEPPHNSYVRDVTYTGECVIGASQ